MGAGARCWQPSLTRERVGVCQVARKAADVRAAALQERKEGVSALKASYAAMRVHLKSQEERRRREIGSFLRRCVLSPKCSPFTLPQWFSSPPPCFAGTF